MWIKICGITNLTDAQAAVELGADALGFIFTESKREITPETARDIIAKLPDRVEKIGVFVNQKAERVQEIAAYCGLTGLQLHGDESPEYCAGFPGYQVTKGCRVNHDTGWELIAQYQESPGIDRILLDTFVKGIPGGTGISFPWQLAGARKWAKPLIVAGGITPENVLQAVAEAHPWGIDVSGGVEIAPGKKDRYKIKELMERIENGVKE